MNGYRFAELAPGESFQSPDVCDCCKREGLKRTVKLVNPAGRVVWFGTGCAARAMSIGIDEVRAARKNAAVRASANEAKARDEVSRKASASWFAFLAARTSKRDWQGKLDVFAAIESLGGYKAARAMFEASENRS